MRMPEACVAPIQDHAFTEGRRIVVEPMVQHGNVLNILRATAHTQVSMISNSFGLQLEAGQVLDADLKGF